MKENNTPVLIRRVDYTPPQYWVDSVSLVFRLEEQSTQVTSTLSLRRNADSEANANSALVLDGVDLELLSVAVDGNALAGSQYELDEQHLYLSNLPESCEVTIDTRLYPDKNTALEGLYRSSGNYCTQCEAEGFRKITYYLDRPDVLAKFDVRIEADQDSNPVLLSNGNKTAEGQLTAGRHFVEWSDPFPKPAYLFALVAGRLDALRDTYVTRSGREVELIIYVESHNLDKCDYAMRSLKESMRWDEDVFGLEYDLDIFMIVAVDDFNMGAMENKGLNVFNSKFVLADQATATDEDFMRVEAVIAHEYFHNWTGNRITCRDWFQLSLKEGLTVFRDQQFSADMNSRAVKRIEDVRLLRLRQFPEDAGPMAHPIRPDEYMEINNFYTVTIYEKGAEVIRMLHTLLGEAGFRRGMDLYFERFDGMAVTCDDFVQAMQDANTDSPEKTELTQFRRWYSQSGTPLLKVTTDYDDVKREYRLRVVQSCPATPGQQQKQPFHMPFSIALLGPDGQSQALLCEQSELQNQKELTLNLTEATSDFVFREVTTKPVPSLLRNFSAPVIMQVEYTDAELAFLMTHDSDDFNRWEAGQRLYKRVIESLAVQNPPDLNDAQFDDFHRSVGSLLSHSAQDSALLSEALTLPTIESVAENHDLIDINGLHRGIKILKTEIAHRHQEPLLEILAAQNDITEFKLDSESIGRRSLSNTCLHLIGHLDSAIWLPLVMKQFETASNMTDKIAALRILCSSDVSEKDTALESFYQQWRGERLVLDKWFTLQALVDHEQTVEQVQKLSEHAAFEITNPNRVRSLIGAFSMSNIVGFHTRSGAGYELLADFVLRIDKLNPQIAARLAVPLGRWQRVDIERQERMQRQLRRILEQGDLSADVYEIINKSLSATDSAAT